jgi:hypothetical protein
MGLSLYHKQPEMGRGTGIFPATKTKEKINLQAQFFCI